MAALALPLEAFEVVVIKVTGDQILDRALKDIGGKGLFTREIEEALLDESIDIAAVSYTHLDVYKRQTPVRAGPASRHIATPTPGLTDISTTPAMAMRMPNRAAALSGSPSTRAAVSATITGSVFSQAVVTAKLRLFIVTSISAVAAIWATAPRLMKPALRRVLSLIHI